MANTKISALTAATTPLAGTEVLPIVQSGVTKQVSVANLTAGRAVSASSLSSTTKVSAKIATSATYYRVYEILATGGTAIAEISYNDTNDTMRIANLSNYVNTSMTFYVNAADRMEIMPNGDIKALNGNIIPSTAAKGINFTANSAAAGMTSQLLNWYEEITAASTACTGAITTAVSWKLTRVGNLVTLTLPPVTGAATSSINFEFGVLIPSGYRPSSSLMFPCGVRDNDANQSTAGMCIITSAGNIRVYLNIAASANFTANASSTACGFAQGCGFSCSWRL